MAIRNEAAAEKAFLFSGKGKSPRHNIMCSLMSTLSVDDAVLNLILNAVYEVNQPTLERLRMKQRELLQSKERPTKSVADALEFYSIDESILESQ